MRIDKRGSVIIGVFPEDPSVADIDQFFDHIDELLNSRQRFAVMLDASGTRRTSNEARDAASRRFKERSAERKQLIAGEAVVVSSALVRGALASMYLVAPPGYPTKTFSKVDEAHQWLSAQLG